MPCTVSRLCSWRCTCGALLLFVRRPRFFICPGHAGEGSISERKDGRVDVELTVHKPDGTRRLRTTKKNKTLARQWIAQMRRDYEEGGLDVDSESITFGEYLDRWIEDVVKGSVARHTYRDYEGKVRLHLKPALGRVSSKPSLPRSSSACTPRRPSRASHPERSSTSTPRPARPWARKRSGISYARTSPATPSPSPILRRAPTRSIASSPCPRPRRCSLPPGTTETDSRPCTFWRSRRASGAGSFWA